MLKKDMPIIKINYNIGKGEGGNSIYIFGSEFVKNNKKNCKMIINNKEYGIEEQFNIEKYTNNKLEIKLRVIDNMTNMRYMFKGCISLSSLSNISKLNTNNVTDMNGMFNQCSSLSSLPDISK